MSNKFVSRVFCVAVMLGSVACGSFGTTPLGIRYGYADGVNVPWNAEAQLDAAWKRDAALVASGQCMAMDDARRTELLAHFSVTLEAEYVRDDMTYQRYYDGLTVVSAELTRLAVRKGRIPAAAHEFWHQLQAWSGAYPDGDVGHDGPCWDKVDGDTAE